ncbi:MAG: hypothetical protein U0L51_06300 [Olegusella sp.]|nr:hypothetical protein [Olegusella sp.]
MASPARTPRQTACPHHLANKRVLLPLLAAAFVACVLALPACGASSSAAGPEGSAAAEAAKYQVIGSPTLGYVDVPKEWVEVDTQEVSSGDGSEAASLSQGVYYADSEGADATAMIGMLSYGAFDHDLDDKVANEFVMQFEAMGYKDIAQVDIPLGDDIASQCYTMTASSGNPGALFLVKNGDNLIGIIISTADGDALNTYLSLVQRSYKSQV